MFEIEKGERLVVYSLNGSKFTCRYYLTETSFKKEMQVREGSSKPLLISRYIYFFISNGLHIQMSFHS